MKLKYLFSPGKIGNVQIKNRIVRSATGKKVAIIGSGPTGLTTFVWILIIFGIPAAIIAILWFLRKFGVED